MKVKYKVGDRFRCDELKECGIVTIIDLTKNSVKLQFERDANGEPFVISYTIKQFEGWFGYPKKDQLIKISVDVNKIWKKLCLS